jgi:hypothetical protein
VLFVQPEPALCGDWNLDGVGRITGRRVRDRQDDHYPLAGYVRHRQKHDAWPILCTFLQAPPVFATPKVGVADDHAGDGSGKSHPLGGEFVIEEIRLARRFRPADRFDIRVGEILDREHLAIALFSGGGIRRRKSSRFGLAHCA